MASLLALADVPNQDALALAPVAGWLMLACAVCLAVILVVHREGFRRLVLRAEDPRTMAVFRIAFGLCCLCQLNGLWELFEFLFTDEGLFLGDDARQVLAREQFQGFGNGLDDDPYGFFDVAAVLQWLQGPKWSLLFFWDSPTAFWIHLWAFELAMACVILGFGTRWAKWIAWLLFHSIIDRNSVYWEGTENVYRTFFFYLCLSRCGHAWSVDNWLRCRRLRRVGRLSLREGPGHGAGVAPSDVHPHGLEPIYRLIPAWPRLLVILQCAAIYCDTGAVKNGSVWWKGDAFYYALSLDHFWRVPPQPLAAIFGTNLFRLNTHVAHAWEVLFGVCVFGLLVRFGLREGLVPPPRERAIARASWIVLGLGVLALVEWLYPVHHPAQGRGWWTLQRTQLVFAAAWLLGMALVGWGWHRLRWRPFRATWRGRTHSLDLDWFCRWFLGRRVWVTLGVVFHLHLIVLMNIGWFSPGALTGFVCFFNASELLLLAAIAGRALRRVGLPMPRWIVRGEAPTPAEDPTLPHLRRDAALLPARPMLVAITIAIVGVVLTTYDVLRFGWTLAGIAAYLAGALARAHTRARGQRLAVDPGAGPPALRTPWAYGPIGRFVAACVVIFHVVGVACWLLPDKASFDWRKHTHKPFTWWLRLTHTTQSWRMFAPNPPRTNLFLRVLVTDAEGEVWDMNTDMYAEQKRPIPWIWYTRERKINRRIGGGEGGKGEWYQKWHARYWCRKWALDHDGELPSKVELLKITYPIPTPEQLRDQGPYDPVERLRERSSQLVVHTVTCAREPSAQPPNSIRARHGLPEVEGIHRPNDLRGKLDAWERKRARERKLEDEAPKE